MERSTKKIDKVFWDKRGWIGPWSVRTLSTRETKRIRSERQNKNERERKLKKGEKTPVFVVLERHLARVGPIHRV